MIFMMAKSQSKAFLFRLATLSTLGFFLAANGQTQPVIYNCPQNNGVLYTTPAGVTFKLLCGQGTYAKQLDGGTTASLALCADWCAESPECQSCDWGAQNNVCIRFKEYIPTVPNPNINTWFPLEERKPEPRPDPTVFDQPKCPTNLGTTVEKANAAGFTNIQTQDALCPTYDGKIYITHDGSYFKTRCGHQNKGADKTITTTKAITLAECTEFCGITAGCKSVTFNPPTYKCWLLNTGEPDLIPNSATGKDNSAYLIDPPTYDVRDEITIKCSTTCPGAHGQTFEDSGVVFRMTCCKRHGIVPFAVEPMPSFTECMKACSKVTPCASVDYHERSGQCYFGKHFGEATIHAPGWASAYSIGCAGTCEQKDGCCSGGSQNQQVLQSEL